MTQTPKFQIGQTVYKWTGGYDDPGVVRGVIPLPDGKIRYLVGHQIQGGEGEFLHVYAAGNLRPFENGRQSGLEAPSRLATGAPANSEERAGAHPELLNALVEAHRQVDLLLAMVVMADKSFFPSQSPLWPEIVRRAELIQKHGATL